MPICGEGFHRRPAEGGDQLVPICGEGFRRRPVEGGPTYSTLVYFNLPISEVGHLLEGIHRDEYRTNIRLREELVKETSVNQVTQLKFVW